MGIFVIHVQHNRAHAEFCTGTDTALSYRSLGGRRLLWEENHCLRVQPNSIITQLNEVLAQLRQANAERTLLKQRITETENVFSAPPNENIVQTHLNIALLNISYLNGTYRQIFIP